MNILMFDYEYPPLGGGGGVVHALIAAELARSHRVCVITSAFADLPRHEIREGVEIIRVPILGRKDISVSSLLSLLCYPPSAWPPAIRLLRKERFDVINGHFAVPTGLVSLPMARRAGVPHVLSIHGGDIYDPSKRLSPHRLPMVRSAVRRTLRGSSAVVAQSANTSENARKYYGFEGPIEIIPLGIRVPSVTPASRRALGLPDDVFLGVTVGRLVRRKALDLLLRAVAQPQNSSVYLALVGDGPELGSLRTLAAQLGLEERVLFLGRVDEVRKWQILAVSDAYLSSTMHEGFGMVYLEAMASGIPIVTPDHGGQIDFLRDGETGYLAPAGDEGALGSAIARLHRAPEVRTEMGRHNLALAPRFRIERCAASYEALFDGLIRKWTRMNPVPR